MQYKISLSEFQKPNVLMCEDFLTGAEKCDKIVDELSFCIIFLGKLNVKWLKTVWKYHHWNKTKTLSEQRFASSDFRK